MNKGILSGYVSTLPMTDEQKQQALEKEMKKNPFGFAKNKEDQNVNK